MHVHTFVYACVRSCVCLCLCVRIANVVKCKHLGEMGKEYQEFLVLFLLFLQLFYQSEVMSIEKKLNEC